VLAMVIVLMGGATATAEAAAPYARITIHAATCPSTTKTIFETCHENHAVGVVFEIAGKAKTTDAAGIASGAPGAGARSVRVSLASYAPFNATGSYVVCTNQVTGKALYAGRAGRSIMITTTANQLTICDWYFLYAGATPPPIPTPEATVVVTGTPES